MASWILVPCLGRLRSDFTAVAPDRDRASDGTIGDQAHADRVSSHNPDETGAVPVRDADRVNEVHAIDVDVDLRTPGLTMEAVVQHLVARCRAGLEDRLRNIIYNRRIWAASSNWKQQRYDGDNPHDKHAHFEASYTTDAEADTRSWRLEDIPVALTSDDKQWIAAEIGKQVRASIDEIWEHNVGTATGQPKPLTAQGALVMASLRSGTAANELLPELVDAAAKANADLNEIKLLLTKPTPKP